MTTLTTNRRSHGCVGDLFSSFGNGEPTFPPEWYDPSKTISINTLASVNAHDGNVYAFSLDDAGVAHATGRLAELDGQTFNSKTAAVDAIKSVGEKLLMVVTKSSGDGRKYRIA